MIAPHIAPTHTGLRSNLWTDTSHDLAQGTYFQRREKKFTPQNIAKPPAVTMNEDTTQRHVHEQCETVENEVDPRATISHISTKNGRLRDQLKPFKMDKFCIKAEPVASRKKMPESIESINLEESVIRPEPARQDTDDSIQTMTEMFVWSSFGVPKEEKTTKAFQKRGTTNELLDDALSTEPRKKRDGKKRSHHRRKEAKERSDKEKTICVTNGLSCDSLAETVAVSNGAQRSNKEKMRCVPNELSCDSLAETVAVSNRAPGKKNEASHSHATLQLQVQRHDSVFEQKSKGPRAA